MQLGSVTFGEVENPPALFERGYRYKATTRDVGEPEMRRLLVRAALDILMLENKVYELETQCSIPDTQRFSVRHPRERGH
jgi:hypothetical protein